VHAIFFGSERGAFMSEITNRQWRPLANPRVLSAIAMGLTLVAWISSGVMMGFIHWDGAVDDRYVERKFHVGPIEPGGGFEQNIILPARYVSSIAFPARVLTPGQARLNLSLFHDDRVVRDGVVNMVMRDRDWASVNWSFRPLNIAEGTTIRLRGIVSNESSAIEIGVTTEDTYKFSIETNGVPAGGHIDLAYRLSRDIGPGHIAMLLSQDNKIVGSVIISMLGIACLSLLALLKRGVLLGVSIYLFLSGLYILIGAAVVWFSKEIMLPENGVVGRQLVGVAGLTLTICVSSTVRIMGYRSVSLLIAIGLSIAAYCCLLITDTTVQAWSESVLNHRSLSFQIPLISPEISSLLGAAASVMWAIVLSEQFLQRNASPVPSVGKTVSGNKHLYAGILTTIFLTTLIIRLSRFVQLDFAPWWDGWGLGHGETWNQYAISILNGGSWSVFSTLHNEGWLYTPILTALLSMLGLELGFKATALVLAVLSSFIALLASWTVLRIGGGSIGAILVGIMVASDPVQMWFAFNGWSDGLVFLVTAISLATFVALIRNPSILTSSLFGLSLMMFAVSHGTRPYIAVWWAFITFFVVWRGWLMERGRTLSITYVMLPLVMIVLGLPVIAWCAQLIAGQWVGVESLFNFAIYEQGSDRTDRLLNRFSDGGVTGLETGIKAVGSYITHFGYFATEFFERHVVLAFPWFPIVGLLLLLATCVTARDRCLARGDTLGFVGAGVLGLSSLLAHLYIGSSASTGILFVSLLWIFMPFSRVIMLVWLPMTIAFLVTVDLVIHQRHSNYLLYTLYIFAAAFIGSSLHTWITNNLQASKLLSGLKSHQIIVGFVLSVTAAVIVGMTTLLPAMVNRAEERAYLRWMSKELPPGATVLTTGNVDPWEVSLLTGYPVLYDVENGARAYISDAGKKTQWFMGAWDHDDQPSYISRVMRNGEDANLWLYSPGAQVIDRDSFYVKLSPVDSDPTQVIIKATGFYSESAPTRGLYKLTLD